ncbi:MAG: carboxypeptidase-like regulatory domain-containing protein, partial [Bacteroidota bacterium]
MKKLFASALLLWLAIDVSGQSFKTISGKAIDAKTKSAIPFCTVYILGESIGTIANESGYFQLNIPARFWNDTLAISHVGFQNFYGIVDELPNKLMIQLTEAVLNLDEVSVATKRLTASEIFEKVIERISNKNGYPASDFRMDGFYREIHSSEGDRTGVLECAVEIYSDGVTDPFKNIIIPQFRKVYDRQENTDQFIEAKEGHNHLLLLLNGGINLIPIGKQYKSSIWQLPLEIEKITYFNDRLVYLLSNESYGRKLKLYVDTENYAVYRNELIMQVTEGDHDNYAWRKVNSEGEKCGAMIDYQGYEYREINGKLYPYYSFRRFDFRCYDLKEDSVSSKSSFSTELLINNVVEGVSVKSLFADLT